MKTEIFKDSKVIPDTDSCVLQAHNKGMKTGSQDWDADTLWTYRSVRPVIIRTLASAGLCADIDDACQEAWCEINRALNRFDPSRGSLGAFMRGVAWRVAAEYVRKASVFRQRVTCLGSIADMDELLIPATMCESQVLDALEDTTHRLLSLLGAATAGDGSLGRVIICVIECDGDTAAAARVLGVSQRTVQHSQAVVRQVGRVLARALVEYERRLERGITVPAEITTILACLPSELAPAFYVEKLQNVEDFDRLVAEDLVGCTGQPRSVELRQGRQILRLGRIARQVIETGRLK